MNNVEYDVFLSYNSVDRRFAEQIKKDLENYGVRVWLDKDEIRPGDLFSRALEKGLEKSRSIVFIISSESIRTGWIREEYYRALSLSTNNKDTKTLIPILYAGADIPAFLSSRIWIDFRNEAGYDDNIRNLVWGITGDKPKELIRFNDESLPQPDKSLSEPVNPKLDPIYAVEGSIQSNKVISERLDEILQIIQHAELSSNNVDFENRVKEIIALTESSHKEIEQLRTSTLESLIMPEMSVVRPNVKLVDANLAYKFADLQDDANILIGFSTLFLGTSLASGISFAISQASSAGSAEAAIHGTVTLVCSLVTGIFAFLAVRARRKANEVRQQIEVDAGKVELNTIRVPNTNKGM